MKVTLLAYTQNADAICAAAGKSCYSEQSSQELLGKGDPEKTLGKIVGMGHHSVIEHASFTFSVEGVSRSLTHQLVRHRVASFSQQSQRYVSDGTEKNQGRLFDFVTPPTIAADPAKLAAYREAMEKAQAGYDALVAAGVPIEDARFVLPGGICTNFVTTLNLRSLLDVYEKRVAVRGAQWEVRAMVAEMARLLIQVEPWLAPFFELKADE